MTEPEKPAVPRVSPVVFGAVVVAVVAVAVAWKASNPSGSEGKTSPPAVGAGPVSVSPGPTTRGPSAPVDPMTSGLDALYTKRDPVLAAARFREVLAQNPEHYGATYQLATALEQAGDPRGARPLWAKMVTMAEGIADAKTAEHARAREAAIDEKLRPASPEDPEVAMRLGLEALYTKKDAEAAVVHFRAVLARSPEHYGATYQLAAALDQARKPAEARPLWTKMLGLAERIGDSKTAEVARARLAKKP